MPMHCRSMLGCFLLVALALAPAFAGESAPWPQAVPGFVAPTAGEHPRLFFRRGDLPALRQRAETAAGKAILGRLRILLGNDGTALPSAYQASTEAYLDATKDLPIGSFTLWHPAGYGLLWQLTQEQRYADLGRQAVEKIFAGQRDRDDRYSWESPGGYLRAGPSVGAIAMAYDLCYDGWDAAFRQQVAQALLHYDGGPTKRDGGGQQTLEVMATKVHMPPFSNHYAGQVGGVTLALLAIRGDAGVDGTEDAALIERYLTSSEKNTTIAITGGFGNRGQYAEGDGPGTITTDTAYVPALQAWRIAGGKDFVSGREDVQWLLLKWSMLTIGNPGAAAYPEKAKALAEAKLTNPANGWPSFPDRGPYPHNVYSRAGSSGSGLFAQGFGIAPAELKPVLLWTYQHGLCPVEPDYDAVSYPHRAVLAFINWPFDVVERNPGEVLPRMVVDERWGLFLFRNRWQDPEDIVISALPLGHKGYHKVPGGDVIVWGLGERVTLPAGTFAGKYTTFTTGTHGGVANTANGSLGVDFSKASGADALIVIAGTGVRRLKAGSKGALNTALVKLGDNDLAVITLTKGQHPTAQVVEDHLELGEQRIALSNGVLSFTK